MTHKLPKLQYEYNALEPHIDAKTMEIHYSKHHQGYVDKLNAAISKSADLKDKSAEELISDLDALPEEIRGAVQNNGGGHVNHSLFWQIMSGEGKELGGNVAEAISSAFGGLEGFKKKFSESAGTRFGSGWAWLVVNADKELEIMSTANQDSPLSEGVFPILGLDVWEHAYYLKYQNRRPDYVEAFFKVVNWEKVEELYNRAVS